MTLILELPDQYGFVLVAATSTFFINTLHVGLTVGARKRSGLEYPIAYASNELAAKDPNAYRFNCTQRAHANFTENHLPFLGSLLIAGLRFPVVSAILGAGWALARVLYAVGYASGEPSGRLRGSIGGYISVYILKFMAAYTSIMFALGR